jgi:3-oxoacyl-[acyl-carrier-protein] synthase-1
MGERAMLSIARAGACTALGLRAASSYAALRAGISRVAETAVNDLQGEPVRAAALELLAPELNRRERMQGLLDHALRELLEPAPIEPSFRIEAFLGLPDDRPLRLPWQTRTFAEGRSSFFHALRAATAALEQRELDAAVVGGVDSLCSFDSLRALADQRRVFAPAQADGIIPGEGAALLLLTPAKQPGIAQLLHTAVAQEPRHFGQAEPNLGDGLTAALRELRTHPSTRGRRVDRLFTCETGERFWAEELACAYFRNVALMPEPFVRTLAAEGFGDLGASAGAVMAAMGVQAVQGGAPLLLVCGSSDSGQVGASLLEASGKAE